VNSTGLGLVGRSPGPHAGSDPDGADRRTVGNLVIEARKYSGLAIDSLVELTKGQLSRLNALQRRAGASRPRLCPAQSLDLHLSANAITKRLSDMTDAELATLEQRIDRRHTDCAGGNYGSVGRCKRITGRRRRGFPAGCPCLTRRLTQNSSAASLGV
jgi:hypothetical protein